MTDIQFTKMHGLGNDFVVIDGRGPGPSITAQDACAIGNRRTGVGFDQLLVLEPPTGADADVFLRIRNPDGSEAGACGNGTRCVAALVMDQLGQENVRIETVAGILETWRDSRGLIQVNMGAARLDWQQIPLSQSVDTLHMGISEGPLSDPVGVNMGNPHAVFFVDDVNAVALETVGPKLEHHPLFPERANIEIVQVLGPDHLRMRVWERSAGITQACGSGACAVAVAAYRRGLTGRIVTVELDGGPLRIDWQENGHVLMTGPVAVSYRGYLDPSLLRRDT